MLGRTVSEDVLRVLRERRERGETNLEVRRERESDWRVTLMDMGWETFRKEKSVLRQRRE